MVKAFCPCLITAPVLIALAVLEPSQVMGYGNGKVWTVALVRVCSLRSSILRDGNDQFWSS